MLMEGIVPGWLGESQKMLMKSAGLLHSFLGDFAVWDSVRKIASLTFTSCSQPSPLSTVGSGCSWEMGQGFP